MKSRLLVPLPESSGVKVGDVVKVMDGEGKVISVSEPFMKTEEFTYLKYKAVTLTIETEEDL